MWHQKEKNAGKNEEESVKNKASSPFLSGVYKSTKKKAKDERLPKKYLPSFALFCPGNLERMSETTHGIEKKVFICQICKMSK